MTHRRADADAVGCASVIKEVLESRGYSVLIVCPEGVSKEARPLIQCQRALPDDIDAVVLVDVASLAQVPEIKKPLVILDHHKVGDQLPGLRLERPSCSELALEIALEAGVKPSRDALIAAALGIYEDTGGLLRADERTFELLKYAVSEVGPLERYLRREEDASLKMAKLKGLLRTSAYRTSRGILCITNVGAHEGAVAELLISAGCDIAIVISKRKDEVRIFLRSGSIDVADLAAKIASRLGGRGGGHMGASAIVLREGDPQEIARHILTYIDPKASALS